MNFVSLIVTLLVGLFILLGSIIGLNYSNNEKITDFSISIAFGVILSLILFEILPETFEILNGEIGIFRAIIVIIILVLIGIVMLKILDLFVPHHDHEAHHHHKHINENCHNNHLHHIGIISSVAVIFHNLIEGMSLYLVTSSNLISGVLLCIGIGLHNVPMGLVIASTLISSSYSKEKTIKISLIVSLSTFVGGFVMFMLGGVNELVEGILLGLTLGMLVYIVVFELAHQIYHIKDKKVVITGITTGILLLMIGLILEHVLV